MNKETERNAFHWLYLCRQLYNACLEQRIDAYSRCGVTLSDYTQQKELKHLKVSFPKYKEVGSQVLKEVVRDLDKAFKSFFRRAKSGAGKQSGFPKFKGRDFFNSFRFPNSSGWKLNGSVMTIKYVGDIRIKMDRPIEGVIKTVTVKHTNTGKWFVVFSCDDVPTKPLHATGRSVGIDVGIKNLLTDSDGRSLPRLDLTQSNERRLRVLSRKLARQKKGSKRRAETKRLIGILHEKIANSREDYACKIAHNYTQQYDLIVMEDLAVKQMIGKSGSTMKKSITDAAWTSLRHRLTNKVEEFERTLITVDPAYTSMTCSMCDHLQDMPLDTRVYNCPKCGLTLDRDHNAAINILKRGQADLANANVSQ